MSTEPNKPDPKDMPINIRMLVAFALTGLVIFGTPYFYKAIGIKLPEKTEQQPAPVTKPQSSSVPPAAAAAAPPVVKPAATAPPAAGNVTASSEENVTL